MKGYHDFHPPKQRGTYKYFPHTMNMLTEIKMMSMALNTTYKCKEIKFYRSMWKFSKFIEDMKLINLPLCNGDLTWTNGREVSVFLLSTGY